MMRKLTSTNSFNISRAIAKAAGFVELSSMPPDELVNTLTAENRLTLPPHGKITWIFEREEVLAHWFMPDKHNPVLEVLRTNMHQLVVLPEKREVGIESLYVGTLSILGGNAELIWLSQMKYKNLLIRQLADGLALLAPMSTFIQ